jgi:amidase
MQNFSERPLYEHSALDLSRGIHTHQFSCEEVMTAFLGQINRLNPQFNAIVNLRDTETLMREAKDADKALRLGQSKGWMHGLPIAVKDLAQTAGLATTMGSVLLKNNVPQHDCYMVSRMRQSGALLIGKTNTPEFGLGSHTFNALFGTTSNAYQPELSAGGSSGGAACALALRMLPIADGSDFMGSLRNPAAWQNIFGLRPSQGRIPNLPSTELFLTQLGVEGPMARNMADLCMLLGTQAGEDDRFPMGLTDRSNHFAKEMRALAEKEAPHSNALSGLKVGWLGDLGAYLPTEKGVLAQCEKGLERLTKAGAHVQHIDAPFDPAKVWCAWLTLRHAYVAHRLSPVLMLPNAKAQMKPEALWEIEHGLNMKAIDFLNASQTRSHLYQQLLGLLEHHDVLCLPSAQVWPFAKDTHWPKAIDTQNAVVSMDTYHRWMEVVTYATLAGLPTLSVPCGFNAEGLPMGLQLIGQPKGEAKLLKIGLAYEAEIQDWLSIRPSALN